MRYIRFKEEGSGMSVRCRLLSDKAPASSEFLSQLAKSKPSFDANHAIWTGPELSCPLPASVLQDRLKTCRPGIFSTSDYFTAPAGDC
jgi:hypothetical protein